MKQYRIYRASKSGGAASYFEPRIGRSNGNNCVFWEMAMQNGTDDNDNAKFFWRTPDKSIITKLNANDIGAILAVLRGKTTAIGNDKNGLFHANSRGNTVLRFQFVEKDGRAYYGLGLSSQRDGQRTEIKHTMSLEEGEILETLLSSAVVSIYGWDGSSSGYRSNRRAIQEECAIIAETAEITEDVNF